jgi:hypothetical protein
MVLCSAILAAALAVPLAQAGDDLRGLCQQFSQFDWNNDGLLEIQQLTPLYQEKAAAEHAGRVVVLVESRLLQPLEGNADPSMDLAPQLNRLVADLAAEGWTADLIEVELPHHDRHQDGLHVLALREFLRGVNKLGARIEGDKWNENGLAGAILIGRFPDAYLVRTCNWRKKGSITLHAKTEQQAAFKNASYLRRVPECVAKRADIVLGDLDGHWENLYVQPRVKLPSTIAVYPDGIPAHGGVTSALEEGSVAYEDFFHILDGRLEVAELEVEGDRQWMVTLFDEQADLECSNADLLQPNRIARPEIWISRIDARGSAWSPSPDVKDVNGKTLLDEMGQPQELQFENEQAVPGWNSKVWAEDPVLERRLIGEYLDRNHQFRNHNVEIAFHPASIAHELASGYGVVKKASKQWTSASSRSQGAQRMADVKGTPDLLRFVQWMNEPAILRTVRAHSDPWGSVFSKTDTAKLDAMIATGELSAPMNWTRQGSKLVPSLKSACARGKLDFYLLRSLWQSGQLPPHPSIYLHTGCDITTPPGAANQPFHRSAYARRAGGAALMFFGRGLALIGRAKVFYDEPKGFSATLASGGTLGDAWGQYFELESRAPNWSQAGGDIGRKRSYFWSVLGDCTLKLNPGTP